jgi:hypothetical protein
VSGDSDVPSWIASVKVILSDLVGFDKGIYYDILAANSYTRQLKEEVKSLTAKQKENMSNIERKEKLEKFYLERTNRLLN